MLLNNETVVRPSVPGLTPTATAASYLSLRGRTKVLLQFLVRDQAIRNTPTLIFPLPQGASPPGNLSVSTSADVLEWEPTGTISAIVAIINDPLNSVCNIAAK